MLLSVNLNKICLLRNSRDTQSPNIEEFARSSLDAGAGGLTLHPRPDLRHAKETDIEVCAKVCQQYGAELNIEGNPLAPSNRNYPGLITLCERYQPAQCTLVPDDDSQLTSDHGWPLSHKEQLQETSSKLSSTLASLRKQSIRIALFCDPEPINAKFASQLDIDRIEIYTYNYALATKQNSANLHQHWLKLQQTCQVALDNGLGVNAGHDLDLNNIGPLKALPNISEVSIGHELTISALRIGWRKAVLRFVSAMRN